MAPMATAAAWARKKAWAALPKRKTVVRAFLCSVLLLFPFLTLATLKAPHLMLPFWIATAAAVRSSGVLADVARQLRWMRRMSAKGPIFWLAAALQRLWVRLLRRIYGDAMDRPPAPPTQIGLTHRSSKAATVKWHAAPRSIYSREQYQLQMRLADPALVALLSQGEEGKALADWIDLHLHLDDTELKAAPLQPDTAYEARVRAVNSKGASAWVSHAFRTKQAAVEGGGTGPLAPPARGSYAWKQHLKDETLALVVPLPPDVRAKHVGVHVMPSTLRVTLHGDTILQGSFHALVKSDELEWEICATDGGKQLVATLAKHEKDMPFWPCLLAGHPEVDVRGLKRDPKELEELLAESKLGEMMSSSGAMPPIEEMMKMRGLDN